MAGGWNHVYTRYLGWVTKRLGSPGIVGYSAHQGPLHVAWASHVVAGSPREHLTNEVPHFESQRMIFFEAHGIMESNMGLTLCYLTK